MGLRDVIRVLSGTRDDLSEKSGKLIALIKSWRRLLPSEDVPLKCHPEISGALRDINILELNRYELRLLRRIVVPCCCALGNFRALI